jgi:hypothetical protein
LKITQELIMNEVEFKNLGVKTDTHWRVKVLAAERGLSIDAMVARLLDEFDQAQKYARMKRLTEEPLPIPETSVAP